jgi:hypothetical protein
MPDVD